MSVFAKQTSRYAKLKNVGDRISGIVLNVSEPRQSMKYDPRPGATRVPDFWESKDGGPARPKMEVVLTLQTDLNEGPDDDGVADDGERKIVVPVFYKEGSQLFEIQKAIVAAGGKDIENGAWLGLAHTGHDPESANMDNPRKLYQAAYKRPSGGGGAFAAGAGQEQPAAQPQQTQQQPPVHPLNGGQGAWQQPAAQPQQTQQQWQQPAAQAAPPAQQQQQAWQPPVQLNTSTGEVNGGVPATDAWGAPAQAAQQPQQGWEPPRDEAAMGQPVQNPNPVQQQALNAFNGGQNAGWQPPAAAAPPAAPAPATQVDVAAIQGLISQGAPDGYIMQQTGASQEAINALRNI